jgi:hypothetical protein
MFRNVSNYAFRIDRHSIKVTAFDDVQPFASAFSPGTIAILDPQYLRTEDRLYHILSNQSVGRALQISLQCKFVKTRGNESLDLNQPTVHAGSLLTHCGCYNPLYAQYSTPETQFDAP